MKNNIISAFILAIVLVLLVVSGPAGCNNQNEINFNSTAILIKFVDNAPPNELVTGNKYPIYVDMKNIGGYDIAEKKANFYLSGIGENLRNLNFKVQNSKLIEKKTAMVEGGNERLTFASEAEPWKTLPAAFNFTMRLDSCYNYATIMQTSICVGSGAGICSLSGEKITQASNTAGPVQITSLTERVVGNKLYVTFAVQNKGLGEVYLPTSDCDKVQQKDINERLNQNQIEIVVRAEEGFECALQPLAGQQRGLIGATYLGNVVCQKTITNAEEHLAPFEVVASYIYKEGINKAVTILPP